MSLITGIPWVWQKINSLSPQFKRYFIIGVLVYLFELAVIVIAGWRGASAVVAVGLSFWLGLVVSFSLQKFFSFKDKRVHHRVLIPQVLAYSVLVLFNFGFTLLVARLLQNSVPAVVSRTLAITITTVWNFYLYKKHIFNINKGLIN